MDETVCPKCGMSPVNWSGNNGAGYAKDGVTYCCKGCAEDTGCTCSGRDR